MTSEPPPTYMTMDEWLYEDFFCREETKRDHHNTSILIVEDDESYRPVWKQILDGVCPDATVVWVRTEEAAERLIRAKYLNGERFNLVIADIYLAGKRTGIDLWRRYGIDGTRFILVSGSTKQHIFEQFGNANTLPKLLLKPFDINSCAHTLEKILQAA